MAAGVSLCGSAFGCAVGGPMGVFGAGNAIEGATGFYNHFFSESAGSYNPVKNAFNAMPGGYGGVIYSGADLLLTGASGFVKAPLKMGLADGLNRPTSMFGVRVMGMDNNYIFPSVVSKVLPQLGRPLPYGTAGAVYLNGVYGKGSDFYKQIESR